MAAHLLERLDRLERLRLEAAYPAVSEHRRSRLADRLRRAVESSSAATTAIIVIIDAIESDVQNRR